MRSQLEIIEQIELYLQGALDTRAQTQFEASLADSSELRDLLHFQRLQIHASRRAAMRLEIETLCPPPRSSFWKRFKSFFTGGLIITGIIAAFSAFIFNSHSDEQKNASRTIPATISTTVGQNPNMEEDQLPSIPADTPCSTVYSRNTSVSYESSSSDHPTWLPMKEQHFIFDAENGGVFEGDEGVLVVVPKDALLTKLGKTVRGKVDFQLVEALNVPDFIAYNLPTMSGKNVLSSGGMLRVKFEQNGEELVINPTRPLTIEVPTSEYNPQMNVWEGIEDNGKIDWQKPSKIKRTLTLVDLHLLDFLPDGFEDAVSGILPYHGHHTISKAFVDSLYFSLSERVNNYIPEAAEYFQPTEKGMYGYGHVKTIKPGSTEFKDLKLLQNTKITAYENGSFYANMLTNGDGWFEVNLKGKKERNLHLVATIPGSNPQAQDVNFVNGGRAQILFKSYKEEEDIPRPNTIDKYKKNASESNAYCFVEPLSIKSLINEKFQHTFIATKEFEERLKVIHTLEDGDKILSIYINNLDQPLWKSDQIAAKELTGEEKVRFQKFEEQRLTNVESNGINQAELTAYYNEKRREYALARLEEHERLKKISIDELNTLQQKLLDQVNNPQQAIENTQGNPKSEEKWRILNRNNVSQRPSYKVSWYSGSWMNLDCYSIGANPQSVDILVDDSENPDLSVYQCLVSLKTLVTINKINKRYQAKFPENEANDTYCLAISKKDNGFLYAERKYNPGTESEIQLSLEKISASELKTKLLLLSPLNSLIISTMAEENNRITKELEIRSRASTIDTEINAIIEQAKIEDEYRNILKEAISNCRQEKEL